MPAGRRAGSDGEQRRAQIITVAQRSIAMLGFEGLRVRDVADQVGINIATLHYYFPSKESLVKAVVDRILGDLEPVPRIDPGTDPEAVLAEHIKRILDRFEADRDGFVVLNELNARAGRDPELRATLQANDEAWAGFLRPLFASGRENGQFRSDLDPDAAAAIVIGFLKSLLSQFGLTPELTRRAADELLRSVSVRNRG
ncbi:TetR/AcrR family transcriptional regulator [Actinoplanes sp. CA-142083]|uniref:TetR/AcrR family transcriptional regulator n=1 Tax=Actinoplanes sp. CA-142083 TaxID=3239903 RepID=UPI003D8E46DB